MNCLSRLCRINLKKKRAAPQIPAKNKRVESLDESEFHQVINTIDPSARKMITSLRLLLYFVNSSWVMWEGTRLSFF